jgi:uncharacterized protein (TIGR02996 family)
MQESEVALLSLLEAWKDRRIYSLARAILGLSDRFLRRHPPIEDVMAWHKLAAPHDPLSVTALLASPLRLDVRALRRQLAVLAEFPPDPRLALFGRRWVEELGLRGQRPDEACTRAHALWRQHGPIFPDDGAPLPPSPGPSEEQQLLAQIVASPEAWGVYADWLVERGDPLGELIARHLRGEELRSLRSPHKERWLRHYLRLVEAHYEQALPGPFALSAHLQCRPSLRSAGEGSVSLLEPMREDLLWARSLPGLTELTLSFWGPSGPARLSEAEEIFRESPVRSLTLRHPCWEAGRHGRAGSWPALERLTLSLGEEIRLDSGFLGELGRRPLCVVLERDDAVWSRLVEVLSAARQAAPGLQKVLLLGTYTQQMQLERDARGQLARLKPPGPLWATTLRGWLGDLPAGAITEVVGWAARHEREHVSAYLARLGVELILEKGPG